MNTEEARKLRRMMVARVQKEKRKEFLLLLLAFIFPMAIFIILGGGGILPDWLTIIITMASSLSFFFLWLIRMNRSLEMEEKVGQFWSDYDDGLLDDE